MRTRSWRLPLVIAAWTVVSLSAGAVASDVDGQNQSTEAKSLAFDVASIKESKSVDRLTGIQRQPGGRVTITNMTLPTLVTFAYQVTGYQLVGGPATRSTSSLE